MARAIFTRCYPRVVIVAPGSALWEPGRPSGYWSAMSAPFDKHFGLMLGTENYIDELGFCSRINHAVVLFRGRLYSIRKERLLAI